MSPPSCSYGYGKLNAAVVPLATQPPHTLPQLLPFMASRWLWQVDAAIGRHPTEKVARAAMPAWTGDMARGASSINSDDDSW